jgi:Zn-dependent protease/predicted transcriptional regulator
MKYSLKIFSILGIPVELHISFIVLIGSIYALAILNLIPGVNLQAALLITLLFVTVVLHELGHSYLAQKYGIRIERIVLLPIGGVSAMEELPKEPGQELRISLAGPVVNFVIAFICYLILLLLKGSYTGVSSFLSYFILLNLILGGFNLLPAYPMDGGRVLRAFLAERMSYIRATELAAGIGKYLAIIMAIVGILVFQNVFLVLIALFIYIGAEQEYQAIMISNYLGEILVENIMSHEVKIVKPDNHVKDVLQTMYRERHMGYPVMDQDKIVGIVTFDDLSRLKKKDLETPIKNFMTKELIFTSPHEQVTNALEKLNQHRIGRLPVTENGQLVGIISRTDIMRALEIRKLKTD